MIVLVLLPAYHRGFALTQILVIEDDELNTRLLESLIRSFGYDPISAKNSDHGLRLARQHKPALILMDLRLPAPGVSGWEATRIIRGDPELHDTPVFAVSVEAEPDDRRRAFEAGCNEYFAKPFSIAELEETIRRYLG
jgi:two-component system cell cycle response regulator DivK